jgi:predicted GIY-YIG superfamily endonuclease
MLKCGIIYKIISLNTGRFYIGSTYDMEKRMLNHNKKTNRCRSKHIIQDGNHIVILLSFYFHYTIKELEQEEGKFIRQGKETTLCVNRAIAGRSAKQYWKDNPQRQREISKEIKEQT